LLNLEKPSDRPSMGAENEPGTTEGKAEEMCSYARREILAALEAKDRKTAAMLMKEHRSYMEVLGKCRGELSPDAQPTRNQPLIVFEGGMQISFGPTIQPKQLSDGGTLSDATHTTIELEP